MDINERMSLKVGDCMIIRFEGAHILWQHHIFTNVIVLSIDLTRPAVDNSLGNKEFLIRHTQVIPVPPSDNVIQLIPVGIVIDPCTAIISLCTNLLAFLKVVGIEIWLDIKQLQASVRSRRNSKWQTHILGVGIGTTCIGRYHLFIDIYRTLYIPVMSLRVRVSTDDVGIIRGITVVDNTLVAGMNEVSRCLNKLWLISILLHITTNDITALTAPVTFLIFRIAILLIGTCIVAHLHGIDYSGLIIF